MRPHMGSMGDVRGAGLRLVQRDQTDSTCRCPCLRPRLDPNVVNVGEIRYGEEKQFSITLYNSGPVEGLFHFVPPPSSSYDSDIPVPALPAWVTSMPDEGIVPPGSSMGCRF